MQGWVNDRKAIEAFIDSLPFQTLASAGPDIMGADDEQDFFLSDLEAAYLKELRKMGAPVPWETTKVGQTEYLLNPYQKRGDCTSQGAGGAIEDTLLAAIMLRKMSIEFGQIATEPLYGGAVVTIMGWRGDHGAYTGAPLQYAQKYGILFRRKYGNIDLTRYDGDKALDYCRNGVPAALLEPQKAHVIKEIVPVKNYEEATSLQRQGYALSVGSNQGFSEARDKDGFCRASGRWAHCTAFRGRRKGRKPGMLYRQSWNGVQPRGGPNTITLDDGREFDMPPGTFFVDPDTFNSMCRSGEAYAISSTSGFELLDNKQY